MVTKLYLYILITSFKELFNYFHTWIYHTIPNFPSPSFLSLCVEMEAKGLVYFTMENCPVYLGTRRVLKMILWP